MKPTECLAFDRATLLAHDSDRWITINGARVKLDSEGNVVEGAEGKIPKKNDLKTNSESVPEHVKAMKLGERQSSSYRNWKKELSQEPDEDWKKRQNEQVRALFKDAETNKEARGLMKKFLSGNPSAIKEVSKKYRSNSITKSGAMDGRVESLAFDRASVRTIDANGRLQISRTNISKANVNAYYGREIPKSEELGLEPDKLYRLWRHPDELRKAAKTFNNIPVLNRHIPDFPTDPPNEFRVGVTHSNTEFDGTYLSVGMSIWDNSSIAGIETGEQRELSASYMYTADMTPGITPDGEPYDGVMRDMFGNHEALVPDGRAGPDVLVADSLPTGIKRMSELTKKLMAVITPLLAKDAKPEEIEEAVEKVAKDEEATRAERDNESEAERLKREERELKEREEREKKDRQRDTANDQETEEEKKEREAKEKAAKDEEDKDKVSKTAMDSAIRLAADSARREASADFRKIREAEQAVRPLIGDVIAMDSADDVYRTALEQSGVDITGVHPSAFPAMVKMAISQKENSRPVIAQDSASVSDFEKAFPTAGKLKRGF